jgi:hypothetical protein
MRIAGADEIRKPGTGTPSADSHHETVGAFTLKLECDSVPPTATGEELCGSSRSGRVQSKESRLNSVPHMPRFQVTLSIGLYCLVLFFAFDFTYSTFFFDPPRSPRRFDPIYHHGLIRSFNGWDYWGESRYRIITNSLGFRDADTREISDRPSSRRIILMGDSFTEGIGVNFEDSFAGMLQSAGMRRADTIEFLNAGVLSYSPSIYYRKIKYLIKKGFQFDELVLFSDISDVADEATSYFCIDEHPEYRKYCNADERSAIEATCPTENDWLTCDDESKGAGLPYGQRDLGAFLRRYFFVTDSTRVIIKHRALEWAGYDKQQVLAGNERSAWLFTENSPGYQPLGVKGGITRSLQNMENLAALLKSNGISLTVVVYPWPVALVAASRNNRQVELWRNFCAKHCKAFIDLFAAFLAVKATDNYWYEHYFIVGDAHFSPEGNKLMFRELAKKLL